MGRIIKPVTAEDELFGSSVRLPKRMWEQLDRIAETGGISRNEAIIKLLDWAIAEQLKDEAAPAPKKR